VDNAEQKCGIMIQQFSVFTDIACECTIKSRTSFL